MIIEIRVKDREKVDFTLKLLQMFCEESDKEFEKVGEAWKKVGVQIPYVKHVVYKKDSLIILENSLPVNRVLKFLVGKKVEENVRKVLEKYGIEANVKLR